MIYIVVKGFPADCSVSRLTAVVKGTCSGYAMMSIL